MAELTQNNNSITTGDFGFSGGVVTSISGKPLGGTGGTIIGQTYYADNVDIELRTGNVFGLTPGFKLSIPTKVSDLTDSASYPKKTYVDETFATKTSLETVSGNIVEKIPTKTSQLENNVPFMTSIDVYGYVKDKQDKLTFGYDSNDKISAINGSALAGEGGGTTYQAGTDLKIDNNVISVDTNGNPHNDTNTHNFVEGSWTEASGYNSHAEGMATTAYGYAVHAQGMWTKFSSNKWSDEQHETPVDIYWAPGAGATVEGYCNSTTSCPMSGTEGESNYGPVHGGVIKVIGNGNVVHDQSVDPDAHEHTLEPSDALIIFKDGTISAFGDIYKNDKKFITEEGIADGNSYAMTTTGWKAIQAGGQGIQQVLHDDTLDGDGASATSLLRVDTTKIQAVSGMSAYATTALLNNVSGELKGMIPTDLFTKASADTLYQPKGDYATTSLLDSVSSELKNTKLDKTFSSNFYPMNTNPSGYLTQSTEKDWTNTIQEASAKAYNDATANANSLYVTKSQYETDSAKYVTSSNTVITGNDQFALTTAGWTKVQAGTSFTGVTTASPITGDGLNNTLGLDSNYKTAIEQVSGKVDKPTDLTSNKPYCFSGGQWADLTQTYYSKSEATGTFLQKNLSNTLSGDGTSSNTLGVNWSNLSSNTINSANSAGEAKGFRWSDTSYQDTSAALTNLWNSKNHVTLQTANNVLTVDNNDNTSATLSAMSYVNNTLNNRAFLPQKACVCLESEITTMATLANGQGMLFFVVSAH